MAIELLIAGLGVTLFGGALFALAAGHRSIEAERAKTLELAAAEAALAAARSAAAGHLVPAFYAGPSSAAPSLEERALRQIERHVQQEILTANLYVDNPSVRNLWIGTHQTSQPEA